MGLATIFCNTFFRFLPLFFIVALTACATDLKKEISEMKPGIYKEDVLDKLGSPYRRERRHGLDLWVYQYDEEIEDKELQDKRTQKVQKEIHFAEGQAVYIGEPQQSKISAEEQDAIYEKQNLELEKQWALRREEVRQALPRYEESVRGENEIRPVPQFEPIE